jgi:hypothetical protein
MQNCSVIGGILLCGGLCSVLVLWGKSRETKTGQCNTETTTVDGAQGEVHRELEGQKENNGREAEQEKAEFGTCIQQV